MWSLYNQSDEFLAPLTYSNKKTQEAVVQEVIEKINEGHKLIFIRGAAGTGKSAIALNLANQLGRTSIVVPVKYLQKQYQEDYTNKLYVKGKDKKLHITVLLGRNNHACLYTPNVQADDFYLPCSIDIKKENMELLSLYLRQNPYVEEEDFETIDDIKRVSVAAACPYWSPIVQKDWYTTHYGILDAKKHEYKGLKNKQFYYLQRKKGCTYYEQFQSYIKSDVMIFNAKKYEIENLLDRKPATEVEVIDECDEFLDSLSNEKKINFNNFSMRLDKIIKTCNNQDIKNLLLELNNLIQWFLQSYWIKEKAEQNEILKIQETKLVELFNILIKNDHLLVYEELEHYYATAKNFENFMTDTYVNFYYNAKGNLSVKVVNINLQKKLKELMDKNKAFVMMSSTLHSPKVLKNIFGIQDFVIVEAETADHGTIKPQKTRLEKNFRYKEFEQGRVTREQYLKALAQSIAAAQKPVLIHVNSYGDLPTQEEKDQYNLSNIQTRERLEEQQEKYKQGELLQLFKEKKLEVLYSTRCARGIDFPGDMCNSIVFTKYPYPSMQALYWRILRESHPDDFLAFYFDKARREFYQRIYRGLRSKQDHIAILSPDEKIFQSL